MLGRELCYKLSKKQTITKKAFILKPTDALLRLGTTKKLTAVKACEPEVQGAAVPASTKPLRLLKAQRAHY